MIIRRDRRFALLWLSGLLSNAGNWLLIVAVPVYVFTMTGSTLTGGIAFLAQILPALLLAPVAGALVDRWDRRTVMVVADLARVLIVLLMTAADDEGSLWLLYAALFAESAAGQFFQPAARAAVPAVVGRGTDLESANSWTTVAGGVVRLAGGPAGGALYAVAGFDGLVLIDAATYLVSALLIMRVGRLRPTGIPLATSQRPTGTPATTSQRPGPDPITANRRPGHDPNPANRRPGGDPVAASLWGGMRAGLRFLFTHRVLRALLAVSSLFLLANAALTVLLVPYVVDRLGGGAGEVGLLMSALGVGFLLSAWAGNVLSRSGRLRRSVSGCLFAVTGAFAGFFLIPDLRSALVFIVLIGVPGGAMLMLVQVQIQRRTPDGVLGRVGSAFAAVEMAATAAGGAAGSVLGDRLPFTVTIVLALAIVLVAAVLALFTLPGQAEQVGLDSASTAAHPGGLDSPPATGQDGLDSPPAARQGGLGNAPAAGQGGLAEEDAGEDEGQAGDLAGGQGLAGDRGAEQHAGDRVEQADQAHGAGAQVPQPGEPRRERQSRRHHGDVTEGRDRPPAQDRRRPLDRDGDREQDHSPGDQLP